MPRKQEIELNSALSDVESWGMPRRPAQHHMWDWECAGVGRGAEHLNVRARHVLQILDDTLRLPVYRHLCQTCTVDNHSTSVDSCSLHADVVVARLQKAGRATAMARYQKA